MHGRLLFRRELVVACACGCVRSIDGEGVNWVGVGFGAWCAAVNSGRESHAIHGGIYSGDAVGNGWMGDDSALGGRVCRVQAAGATCGCTRRRRRWRRKAGRGVLSREVQLQLAHRLLHFGISRFHGQKREGLVGG